MNPVRSIPSVRQLLVPLILLGVAIAGLALFAGWWEMNRQLDAQLTERARTVARALRFAAETTDSRESITRLTRAFVAGGDVELVLISGGNPRRVMISSQDGMQGVLVERLPDGGFAAEATTVLSGESREPYLSLDRTRGRFVYSARLGAAFPAQHPLVEAAVLIELPARALQERIAAYVLWSIAGVVVLGAAGATGFAWLLQVKVLRPLAVSLEREREAGRAKVNFLGMISHEFRNKLGLVLSSTQILSRYGEKIEPAERVRHLEKIEASCRRLSAVVEDTMFYSRSESGRVERNLETLDLHAFCRGEVRAAEPAHAGENGARVRFVIEPGAPAQATTDESLLRHVISNLLANALKYSDPATPVVLALGPLGAARLQISVADRGIGIPADERARVGKPFWRGRNVGAVSGTGLGLVIVGRCLEMLGGQMRIESPEAGGTRVVVTLPIVPPSA